VTFSKHLRKNLKPSYRSKILANIFYRPLLSEANSYKRVSAYFSSQGLELYSQGLEELFKNGGYAKFIISTNISENDFEKIQNGYKLREKIEGLPFSIKKGILNSKTQTNLGNLAFMIAQGRAEVKFAIISDNQGIFHDKFGLISSDKDVVFFTGSVNETQSGLEHNYESISVDFSWDNSNNVRKRIYSSERRFDRL